MYGNFRELEDGSKELSCQGESAEVEGRDANFGAYTQSRACTESVCNQPYGRVLDGVKDCELGRRG